MQEEGADATALAYAMLCSDFPELNIERLTLLEAALAVPSASLQLCPAFLAGAAHGACKKPQAAAAADDDDNIRGAVPGLVASAAPPSQYAVVYARGAVLRACSLLLSSGEVQMRTSLAGYHPPPPPPPDDHTLAADDYVPEVFVAGAPASAAATAAGAAPDAADDEEVWAAEPDEDDAPYEPLEPLTPLVGGNGTIGASGCRIARAVKAAAARLARIDKIMEGVDELLRGAPPSLGSRSSLQVLFNDLLPTAMAVARSTIWMCVAVAAVAPPFLTAAKGWRCWCLPAARHRRPAGARGRTGHIKDHQDLATSPRSLAAAARESATDHKLWAAWENQEAA